MTIEEKVKRSVNEIVLVCHGYLDCAADNQNFRDRLDGAEAERDAARAEVERLREDAARAVEALVKLSNEIGGLCFEEAAIRTIIGNTNWSVLQQRVDEARAILDACKPGLDWLAQQRREAAVEALEKLAADLRQDPWGGTLHDVDSLRGILRTRAAEIGAGG